MDLALNNQQKLIYHKTQPTKQLLISQKSVWCSESLIDPDE